MPDDATPPAAGATILEGSTPPPAPTFTPSFEGVIGPDGSFTEGWHQKALGPDYNGPLAGARTLPDVDKMLRDSMAAARQKTAGMVRVPSENAKPEEVAEFRKALGVPEKPDDYGDLRPDTIPPEMWDPESSKALSQIAHKHNLPPAAIKEIVGLYAGQIDKQVKLGEAQQAQYMAGEVAILQKAWGNQFSENINIATRVAATIGLDPKDPALQNSTMVQALRRVGDLISGDKLVNGATIGLSGSPKDQAQAIMTDPSNPHYKAYQSGDPNAVALVENLLKQA